MKLAYTIIYVDDVQKSLAFYEQAFGLKTRFLHESGDWGELDTGSTVLAFSSRALMASMGKPTSRSNPENPAFEIALTTDDVAAAVDKATKAGAKLISAPEDMPWGQTVAYVADSDGVLIEVCTVVSG